MKKVVSGLMGTLLLVGLLTLTFNVQPAKAEPTTITVPDDYPTIQKAINAAGNGDIIFVRNGTYYESIIVHKSVSLVGESRHATIVNASGNSSGFKVTMDNVSISNFKIIGAGWTGIWLMYSGTTSQGVDNCAITNNTITKNGYGIYVGMNSDYSTIKDNNITYNWDGIWLNGGHSYMKGNVISRNRGRGIRMECSVGNFLRNNTLVGNSLCILGELAEFIHDIDTSNTINGKPIYYLVNQHGLEINFSTCPNPGFLGLINSTNITVEDMLIDSVNIMFAYVSNSIIQNMTVTNAGGMVFWGSKSNVISRNTIVNNGNGIILERGCRSNIIIENVIRKNRWYGIQAFSGSNVIYHNSFIDNKWQVFSLGTNVWDDGYPSGGNYWSDYNGTDVYSGPFQNETGSDGIGDSPYLMDRYPLMQPWPDATPPSITVLSPENGTWCHGRDVALNFTINEPASWVGYSLDNKANVSITGDITLPDLSYGLHNITVYANDTYGNMGSSMTAHFTVTFQTDLNYDGVIDMKDLAIVAAAFGESLGRPRWNPIADVNHDDIVDMRDIALVAKDFGKTW